MSKKFFLNLFVSLLLILLVIYIAGGEKVAKILASVNLHALFLAIFWLFILYLIMAFRIYYLLRKLKEKVSYWDVLKAHFGGMLAADFTPARVGYFTTALSLKYNYKIPSEKAFLVVLGPQVFDFLAKVLGASIGIFFITTTAANLTNPEFLFFGVIGLAAIILVMLLLLFSPDFVAILHYIVDLGKKLPLGKIFLLPLKKLLLMVERMQNHSDIILKEAWLLILCVALGWTAKAISWYYVGKAVGMELAINIPEVGFYFIFQPLVTILEFLPSPTLAGMGLSEGGSVVVLGLVGVEPAVATAFALLARFKTTLLSSIIGVKELMRLSKNAKEELKKTLQL